MTPRTAIITTEEWQGFRDELESGMAKIETMQDTLVRVVENTEHLQKLDSIADTLSELKETFVDAAIGRKQVPLGIVSLLCGGLMLLLIGLVFEKSGMDLSIPALGIHIGQKSSVGK